MYTATVASLCMEYDWFYETFATIISWNIPTSATQVITDYLTVIIATLCKNAPGANNFFLSY